ncbi:MAG: bifunctional oligoribonuclease/PAP phosphatase NrnA [Planctomycetaceae bacterium]|nr:bifunctional oligoribonuclease/PAP phosphatase NrnA [Planctomycetaceae bacterium]
MSNIINTSAPPIDWAQFAAIVSRAQRFLLTVHIRPDGDCIGSELAMAAMLRQLGKEVRLLNADRVPPDLRFLSGADDIEYLDTFTGSPDNQAWLGSVDVIMVLDTISWAQLGPMKPVLQGHKGVIVAIDHHAIGDDIGAVVFSDTHAEATGRLVFEAVQHLGVELTPDMATALFTAIATDTGWFRFSSVTDQTFAVAAELVRAGAKPHVIYNHLYEQMSAGKIRLIGRTLAKVELHLDGKLAFTSILLDDFAQSGAIPGDSEDIVNKTLAIGGTQMAIIIVEQQTGGFKISFRSRCGVDCSKVAARFGGGGHRQAAGASQNLPYDELKTVLIAAMTEAYGIAESRI